MLSRSSWLHLRIPFSYFLLPIFLFSLCISPNFNGPRIGWVFLILHFFLYPASNGYNSYFDKDEKSIGGLKNPPPVSRGLYYLSLVFDVIAVVLAVWKINLTFAAMVLVYGLVSKAYSHPSIRLKKLPYTSWVITGVFQGLFTFVMCYIGVNDYGFSNVLNAKVLVPGVLTSLMLWANYPMTQIYQHEEDAKRGDITLSQKLGIKGTFYFAAIFFSLTAVAFSIYLSGTFGPPYMVTFLMVLAPVLLFFSYWLIKVRKSPVAADHRNTMMLNFISGTCMNAYFVYLFLESSQVLQAVQGGF